MKADMKEARHQPAAAQRLERRAAAGPSGAADAGASSTLSQAAQRANAGPHASSLAQLQAVVAQRACADCETVRRTMGGGAPVQRAADDGGGLPGDLRAGLEHLSGRDLSGVRVNYDSPRPAQLDAHAVAQGPVIDVAPGQEKHLAHEGWHAVQQMQNRVRPTMDLGGTPVNDDPSLEREADVMGARALAAGRAAQLRTASSPAPQRPGASQPVQRKLRDKGSDKVDTPAGAISKATGIPGKDLKLGVTKPPVGALERAREVSAKVDKTTLRTEDRVDHVNLGKVTSMARAEQTILQGAEAPGFYHAGHLVADFLVGSSDVDERFAMWNLAPQVAALNSPAYYNIMETDVKGAAEEGRNVKMKVTLGYPGDAYTVTPRTLKARGVIVGEEDGDDFVPAGKKKRVPLDGKISIPRRIPNSWSLDVSVDPLLPLDQKDKSAYQANAADDVRQPGPTIGSPYRFHVKPANYVLGKLTLLATDLRQFVASQWAPPEEGVHVRDIISLVASRFPAFSTRKAIKDRLADPEDQLISELTNDIMLLYNDVVAELLVPKIRPPSWTEGMQQFNAEARTYMGAKGASGDPAVMLTQLLGLQRVVGNMLEWIEHPELAEPDQASDRDVEDGGEMEEEMGPTGAVKTIHLAREQPVPEAGGAMMGVPADLSGEAMDGATADDPIEEEREQGTHAATPVRPHLVVKRNPERRAVSKLPTALELVGGAKRKFEEDAEEGGPFDPDALPQDLADTHKQVKLV
jgi:hypothetical protein